MALPWFILALTPAGAPSEAPETESRVPQPALFSVPVVHTTSLFVVMRVTEAALWPRPFADRRPRFWLENYEQAFTRPPLFDPRQRAFEWDHDHWSINVVGHGLLGSELYYRPRRCGASALQSFLFASAASAVWEYAFEANGVRPSALDLAFTPISGLLLGEARFVGWTLAGGIDNRSVRSIVRGILDPLGELSRTLGSPC